MLQAIINAANIAPPADIIFPIIIAALAGIQLAAIIATPVPQAAEGRYDVIGQQDGKLYKNVPHIGTPKTGLYKNTFLGSENGGEIVIDTPTTENLMMNYPDVIKAIKYASTGAVPQRAEGYYPDMGSTGSRDTKIVYMADQEHTAAI